MQLHSKKTLDLIKESIQTRNRLAYEFSVAPRTIDRWIVDNSPMLVTPTAMKAIAEELELKKPIELIEQS